MTTRKEREYAARAAIERALTAYITLDCGHVTTRETIDVYGHNGKRTWCEKCRTWQYRKTRAKPKIRTETIELPPF